MDQIVRGVRNAHAMIRNNYFSHVVPGTEWINFSNAANAGTNYLDRASFQMFVLYGNGITTTRYYDSFTDHLGVPLDTGTFRFYRMTFPADQIPEATRFWSVTAYLTPALNLLPGPVNGNMGQENVSSYAPGLQKNRDGSITIYIQPNRPSDRIAQAELAEGARGWGVLAVVPGLRSDGQHRARQDLRAAATSSRTASSDVTTDVFGLRESHWSVRPLWADAPVVAL